MVSLLPVHQKQGGTMKQLLGILAMACVCLSANAQISSDEAMAKLKAKESATTQPSDPSRQFRDLKTEVEMLHLQEMALAAQVKDLQKQLAELKGPSATTNPTVTTHSDWKDQLKLGMSEDDVDLVFVGMKHIAKKIVAVTETRETVLWVQTAPPNFSPNDDSATSLAKVTFVSGKVSAIVFP
jgi:hypothetical protein